MKGLRTEVVERTRMPAFFRQQMAVIDVAISGRDSSGMERYSRAGPGSCPELVRSFPDSQRMRSV